MPVNWNNSIGLDAVLYGDDYLATSEGDKLSSVKSYRKSQERLAKISTRKNKKKKESQELDVTMLSKLLTLL